MISDLQEIRADGKVIAEAMTSAQMRALGWQPCLVTSVRWNDDGRTVELKHAAGLNVEVLPSRELVAALVNDDASAQTNRLCVFNRDGSLRHRLANVQDIRGTAEAGSFGWFERVQSSGPNAIHVVFELDRSRATYWLELDAANGRIIGSRQVS